MSNTIKSLNAIYTQQIAEDEDRVAITPEDAAAVGQHVRAIKYEARKSGEPLPRAYNTYVGKHNLTATQRRITKEKLGLAEEVEAPIKIKPKDQKEDFIKLSDWRYELREVDMPSTGLTKKKKPTTSEKSREKITEKPINNKVEINPTMNQLANSFNHELHAMGGQLLEMVEIKETMVDQIPLSPQELIIQRRMAMLNMRLARKNTEKVNKIKKDSPGVVDPAKLAKKPPEEKKVEEEVGISSTEKMQKALKDAALRRKEQQKVAKKKSVKEGKIADALKKTVADMKAADRKAGLLPGGKEVIDLSVERQRRRKEVKEELSDRAKKEVESDAKNVDNPLYKPGKRTVKQLAYGRELALKKKKVVDESRDSAGGDLDKEPPSWASMNPQDRGNPAYMKTSSLKDEEKWKRLQKMRKASKKKEVRAKANEEVVHESGWHRRNPDKVGTPADPDFNVLKGSGKVKDIKDYKRVPGGKASKKPPGIYKPNKEGKFVKVDEEKKALPKLKMYRKAGNLARAGDEKSMKRQTKIVSTLNKETSKGYKKAALDKLRDGGSPKHQKEDYEAKKTDEVLGALQKKKKDFKKRYGKMGPDVMLAVAKKTVKKKGDTSKSDDRYAYESVDPAFDNVVSKLRAKYGKDSVLTKDSPKPKAQPKPKAKPQKPLTDKEKAHREVVARYGGESNYKAGRGLGT